MGAKFRIADRRRIRRLMASLPGDVDKQITHLYQQHAPAILAKARAEVPVRSGGLRNALAFKIAPGTKSRSTRLRIGLLTKRMQDKFFYAHILEYGRRAKTVKAQRRGGNLYQYRVSAIPAGRYDFVRGRTALFMQQTLGRALRGVLGAALKNAARGAGNGA